MSLLEVKDLSVGVEDADILHGINLNINAGETHVLMGPNGAGKSTLGYALMGNPNYHILSGEICFDGRVINEDTADKRALAVDSKSPGGSGNIPVELCQERGLPEERRKGQVFRIQEGPKLEHGGTLL